MTGWENTATSLRALIMTAGNDPKLRALAKPDCGECHGLGSVWVRGTEYVRCACVAEVAS